jgi:hypothetical protein
MAKPKKPDIMVDVGELLVRQVTGMVQATANVIHRKDESVLQVEARLADNFAHKKQLAEEFAAEEAKPG